MNNKYLDKETFCQNCGKSLGTGYVAQRRKYCSVKCQMSFQNQEALKLWLATGETKFTGGADFTAPRGYIRRYIAETQQGKCAICKCDETWNGKPLVFIMDHIDGDSSNNSPQNLRLLCPNCNSQTDTFSGRNRGNGKRKVKK